MQILIYPYEESRLRLQLLHNMLCCLENIHGFGAKDDIPALMLHQTNVYRHPQDH
jgi:hypothetical protein